MWYYSSVFNWDTPLIYLFSIKGQAIRLAFLCIKLLSKLPCTPMIFCLKVNFFFIAYILRWVVICLRIHGGLDKGFIGNNLEKYLTFWRTYFGK